MTVPKTDQVRIQNLGFDDLLKVMHHSFEVTTKMVGLSMTVYRFNNNELISQGVCSRNLDLDIEKDPDTTFARTATEAGLLEFLEDHDLSLALQGELMGPGIQGNREKLKEHTFFLFDIYDIKGGRYLDADERFEVFASITEWQARKGKNQFLFDIFGALLYAIIYEFNNLKQIPT